MLIRISYILSEADPIFPGNPHNSLVEKTSIMQGEFSNTSEIKLFTHNGTHMDAPYHFDPKGLTIDQLHSRYFFYSNPFVLSLKKEFSDFKVEMAKMPLKLIVTSATLTGVIVGIVSHLIK